MYSAAILCSTRQSVTTTTAIMRLIEAILLYGWDSPWFSEVSRSTTITISIMAFHHHFHDGFHGGFHGEGGFSRWWWRAPLIDVRDFAE